MLTLWIQELTIHSRWQSTDHQWWHGSFMVIDQMNQNGKRSKWKSFLIVREILYQVFSVGFTSLVMVCLGPDCFSPFP